MKEAEVTRFLATEVMGWPKFDKENKSLLANYPSYAIHNNRVIVWCKKNISVYFKPKLAWLIKKEKFWLTFSSKTAYMTIKTNLGTEI